MCEYCEHGIILKRNIANIVKEENYPCQETFKIEDLFKYFNQKALKISEDLKQEHINDKLLIEILEGNYKKITDIIETLEDYQIVLFHKNVAKVQRDVYNKQRESVQELRDKIMIEIDFKQKIVIGMSPRQVSSEFYEQVTRGCLGIVLYYMRYCFFFIVIEFEGFGVYYVDIQDKIQLINFDIISNDKSSDAKAVVRGFRILREQDFFKAIEKPNYIVWADTGKHFRNCELLGYLLGDLKELNINGLKILLFVKVIFFHFLFI